METAASALRKAVAGAPGAGSGSTLSNRFNETASFIKDGSSLLEGASFHSVHGEDQSKVSSSPVAAAQAFASEQNNVSKEATSFSIAEDVRHLLKISPRSPYPAHDVPVDRLTRENEVLRGALGDAVRRLSELEGEKERFMSEDVFDLVNSLCRGEPALGGQTSCLGSSPDDGGGQA